METINVLIWHVCYIDLHVFTTFLLPFWNHFEATKVVDSYREDLQRTSDEVKRDLEIRHEDELRERFDTNEGMMQEFTSSFRFGNFRHWYNIKYYLNECDVAIIPLRYLQCGWRWNQWSFDLGGSDLMAVMMKKTENKQNTEQMDIPCAHVDPVVCLRCSTGVTWIMYVILQRDSVMMISGEVIIRKE